MQMELWSNKVAALRAAHEALLTRKNEPITIDNWLNGKINDQMVNDKMVNGIYTKYKYPILTAEHTPLEWRYDFNEQDNPFLMQRIMMNAVLNAGAILFEGKYTVVARVEGADRKSFFAVAQSPNGIDNWRFWPEPVTMPDGNNAPATNVYDMRLTRHEDGWIYGIFCVERHDETKPFDTSAATAAAVIARTKDLVHWERLDDLKCLSPQRNVVLHPEFVKCENEKMGNAMRYTPVRKTVLSRPARVGESAGRSHPISRMLRCATNASSSPVPITPSMKLRTAKDPHPSRPPRGGFTLLTAYAPPLPGSVMCSICI